MIKYLFSKNDQDTTIILSVVFPGIFANLMKEIPSKSSVAVRVESAQTVDELVDQLFSPINHRKCQIPSELENVFSILSNYDDWRNTSILKIEELIIKVAATVAIEESSQLCFVYLKLMSNVFNIFSEDFQREFVHCLGFVIMRANLTTCHESKIKSIIAQNEKIEEEILGTIFDSFKNTTQLLNKRRILESVVGLLKITNLSTMSNFVDIEQIVTFFLRRLVPNYSKIVPAGVLVPSPKNYSVPEHLLGSNQYWGLTEEINIDSFAPQNFEQSEWNSIKELFLIIGRSKSLRTEALFVIESAIQIHPGGVLLVLSLLCGDVKTESPASFSKMVTKWSQVISSVSNRKQTIGNNLIYLYCLQKLLQSTFDTSARR